MHSELVLQALPGAGTVRVEAFAVQPCELEPPLSAIQLRVSLLHIGFIVRRKPLRDPRTRDHANR